MWDFHLNPNFLSILKYWIAVGDIYSLMSQSLLFDRVINVRNISGLNGFYQNLTPKTAYICRRTYITCFKNKKHIGLTNRIKQHIIYRNSPQYIIFGLQHKCFPWSKMQQFSSTKHTHLFITLVLTYQLNPKQTETIKSIILISLNKNPISIPQEMIIRW